MIIFNLATDENDPILAFTIDWVKEFHELANVTEVISTHVGSHSLPKSIKVYEIGGGSPIRKVMAILKLIYHGVRIISTNKNTIIFHHMSTYTATILGPLFRIRGFRQGLWYSHNQDSLVLRVGSFTADEIFTPTKDSFPFKSRKVNSVGHGINTKKFTQVIGEMVERSGIVSLGRVTEVKRLDRLIAGAYESEVEGIEVTLIGPSSEKSDVYKSLVNLGEKCGVSVTFLGAVPHAQVAEEISHFSMCYTGSPKTVDKSAIEGALMGCFVLAENVNVLEQTGMNEVWKIIGRPAPATIAEQIQVLSNFESRSDLRKILSLSAIQKNDLKSTARKIYEILSKNG